MGRLAQEATVLGLGAFHCSMLAFIRDSFMASYKWHNLVTVDALDMRHGPRWRGVDINCVDQLCHPAPEARQGSAWRLATAFIRDQCVIPSD